MQSNRDCQVLLHPSTQDPFQLSKLIVLGISIPDDHLMSRGEVLFLLCLVVARQARRDLWMTDPSHKSSAMTDESC